MNSDNNLPWRSVGFWLAVALALSQFGNVLRVAFGAQAYSVYMGLPLSGAQGESWVVVYALRAFFLGSFAGYLLMTRRYRVLSAMALIALVMPLGDFYLVWEAGGSMATLVRHALIAVVLVAAWLSLSRLADRQHHAERS